MARFTKILVSPLDWGLGHVTRCIPIISYLQSQNIEVWVAASKPGIDLLKTEFPLIHYLPLDGYRVQYHARYSFLKLLMQIPKIIRAVKKEHFWLKQAVSRYKFDGIISDNRYGMYFPGISSVFITHQLQIKLPRPFEFCEPLFRKLHYQKIKKFSACWVPDLLSSTNNLSGLLGHPSVLPPVPTHYTDPLSRFSKQESENLEYEYCVLISGPEPQRSILEEKILDEARRFMKPMVVFRGLPGQQTPPPKDLPNHITLFNHLPTSQLTGYLQKSRYVIARSGYSTIMDMWTLNHRCIFIPTPQQTEQIYLANRLHSLGAAWKCNQSEFNLEMVSESIQNFRFRWPATHQASELSTIIEKWLQQISSSV